MGYGNEPRPNSTVYSPGTRLAFSVPVARWIRWPWSLPSQMSVAGSSATITSAQARGSRLARACFAFFAMERRSGPRARASAIRLRVPRHERRPGAIAHDVAPALGAPQPPFIAGAVRARDHVRLGRGAAAQRARERNRGLFGHGRPAAGARRRSAAGRHVFRRRRNRRRRGLRGLHVVAAAAPAPSLLFLLLLLRQLALAARKSVVRLRHDGAPES